MTEAVHPPSASAAALRAAELAFRRFARQTNQLVAGRAHLVAGASDPEGALGAALRAMGAQVSISDDAEELRAARASGATVHDGTGDYLAGARRTSAAERIDWAAQRMPAVAALAGRLGGDGALTGMRIGICLVLEPKTAVLALGLAEAGATVSVFAHPDETDQDVADELSRRGIRVFADARADEARAEALARAFLSGRLQHLIDDGGKLIALAHRVDGALDELAGAAEETTSGLRRLATVPGGLRIPVIAVNDALSKTWFDNAVGTGQSCVSTILDLLDPDEDDWSVVGARVVVAGYGPVGRGVARHIAALGGRVTVVDVDPRPALRAATDGFAVAGDLVEAAGSADLIISATGYPATITREVLRAAASGAAFAVAGGVEDEIQWRGAVGAGAVLRPLAPSVETLEFPDGHAVRVLDRGGCINCTAGEGNPIEIMDLSFGVQLAALEMLRGGQAPSPGIHPITGEADRLVSRIGLDAIRRHDRGGRAS